MSIGRAFIANLRLLDGMVDGGGAQIVVHNSFDQRLEFIESTRHRIKVARPGS